MNTIVTALGDLLRQVPTRYRARVYKAVAVLGSLATLALLLFANGDLIGIDLPDRWTAVGTAVATVLAALAKANTDETADETADESPEG